ncbi:MAG: formylmethanofuran dehydrogenase [Gammaproteobacteria bacterium]|nr:MAG: formylmethanofuran dehydrogenase [Gammaproteobacteria bacterium]
MHALHLESPLYVSAVGFHGHRCPAMPMGLRAGLAALDALGVERARNKELFIYSETGKGHAAGCFLDGLMAATGCTYGKSNIQKLYYDKMAFTLIEVATGRAVRVSVRPDFFEEALRSPFVQRRKEGVQPQDIPEEITLPLVERILAIPEEAFLEIGEIHTREIKASKAVFEVRRCVRCGEDTFVNGLRVLPDGGLACIPCAGYGG